MVRPAHGRAVARVTASSASSRHALRPAKPTPSAPGVRVGVYEPDAVVAGPCRAAGDLGTRQACPGTDAQREDSPEGLVARRIDPYRRPYEGTANFAAAMQAYLDWEYGLIDQLRRDGTPHFGVM